MFLVWARKLIKPHLMQSFGGPNSGPDPSDTWPKCEFEAAAIRNKVRRRMEFPGEGYSWYGDVMMPCNVCGYVYGMTVICFMHTPRNYS